MGKQSQEVFAGAALAVCCFHSLGTVNGVIDQDLHPKQEVAAIYVSPATVTSPGLSESLWKAADPATSGLGWGNVERNAIARCVSVSPHICTAQS